MPSLNQLRKDLEIVRRALNLDPIHESYRERAKEITQCLEEHDRLLDEVVTTLTEEEAHALREKLDRDFSSDPHIGGYDEAIRRAAIHDVLSEYQRRKQEQL